jgi:aspartate kinase
MAAHPLIPPNEKASLQTGIKTLVMKFGGTSVGSAEAMAQAAGIVRETVREWPRCVVVLSAMSGVTNLLLDSAQKAVTGDLSYLFQAENRLRQMHLTTAEQLLGENSQANDAARCSQVKQEINHLIAYFTNLCQAIAVLGEATPRALDAVASLGERMSVRLMAALIETYGIPAQMVEATQLIVTDDHFQDAHPDFPATQKRTRQVLEPILAKGFVPVVTGFIASTGGTAAGGGATTTLGRGGSDYSAAILGAVLPADEVWIWTDVNGVMTADPRLVPQARTIPDLSYREISELAYFGAKVLHPKTIRPVVEAGIGLRICNTFQPEHPGTRLSYNGQANSEVLFRNPLKAVTAIYGQRMITVEGRGMLGVPGMAARTFGAVASTGTSVPLITQASSEQSISFAVPAEASQRVVTALQDAFTQELSNQDIDRIWASEEAAIITAVGAGMSLTPGVAGKIFSALGKKGINILAIAQGSSEVATSLVVSRPDAEKALRSIHDLIIEQKTAKEYFPKEN